MIKSLIGICVVIALIVGGLFWLGINSSQAGAADYKNATYEIDGKLVTLVDGTSDVEDAPGSSTVTEYFGNLAKGDVDGDGITDLAFILTQNGGGSGTFFYAVVALQNASGRYIGTNGILLGDRIAPQTTEIRDGEVVVNYADRRADEPMTAAPSIGISRYLKVSDGRLIEIGGADAPADGIHFGFIERVTTLGVYGLIFDEAKWLTGVEGENAAIAAGLCTEVTRAECLPNDFFILNSSTSTQTIRFSPDVEIAMATLNMEAEGVKETRISLDEFEKLVNDPQLHWTKVPYQLLIQNGLIRVVEEVYVP